MADELTPLKKYEYKNVEHRLKDRLLSLYIYLDLAAQHIQLNGTEFEETYQWIRVAEVNADQAARECSNTPGCDDQLQALRSLRNRLDEIADDFADTYFMFVGRQNTLRTKYARPLQNFKAISKEIIVSLLNSHALGTGIS